MIKKKALALMILLVLLVAAAPALAAQKTFQLHIPGCAA